ncbi:MAG: MFS transporter [Chloroflexi bacterium]|nr:MFS transporter [Chloroflexota bacterium]
MALIINLDPPSFSIAGRKIHYAWAMVVVAAGLRLSGSAVRTSFSVLVPRLVETFGWSVGRVGGILAVQWIFGGLFSPLAGWLGDRYGYRRTMTAGALVFIACMVGASLVLGSSTTSLVLFYLVYGILLSAAMAIFQVPLTAAVTMWFRKHLGLGMGILQSSQGMGPLVFVPLVLFIIHAYSNDADGLRAAFWITGIIGGVVMLLLIRMFYDEPAQIGLKPLGAPEDEPVQKMQGPESARVRAKVFLQQAQRTGAFWNLIGIHFWGCAGHAIIMAYLVQIAEEEGVSPGAAAGLFIALSVVSTITRFGVPIAADRLGSKGAMAFCFFMQSAPIIILFFAHDAWMFYLFAVLFGIGFGGEMSAFPIINRQYYGSAPIGTTFGWQMMGAGIGMAVGVAIGGVLRDLTGDFNITVAISLVLSLVGAVSVLVLPTTSRRQLPHWEDSLPQEARSVTSV